MFKSVSSLPEKILRGMFPQKLSEVQAFIWRLVPPDEGFLLSGFWNKFFGKFPLKNGIL